MLIIEKSLIMNECAVHSHNCWELIFHLSGKGIERLGDVQHEFSAGMTTLCPPHVLHGKSVPPGAGGWQDIALRFQDPAGQFPREPVWLPDDPAHTIKQLVEMILNLFYRNGRDYPVIDQLLAALQALLLERLSPDRKKSPVTEVISRYLSRNYADPACDLRAEILRMNYVEDYVRRIYQREMGMTPHQHLLSLRLEHARQLLRAGNTPPCSIQEVALLSGFDDANYFSRVFRREVGVTPSEYRRQAARKAQNVTKS